MILLPFQTTAAEVRARADRLVAAKRYPEASTAFLEASKRYAVLGDPNAAQILRDYSRRYRTDAVLYVDAPPPTPRNLARLEPFAGCYLGANVEREDGANRDEATFSRRIGRDHALFFIYRSYGRPFPTDMARRLKRMGSGLQIAWEPRDLDEVKDGRYLEAFMRAAAASEIPVFLRFASEMNGNWSRYNGNPARYRESFRRVADMAHVLAPNVAMVWCPADSPEKGVEAYYPGEDAVDWVGVNFYSVLYNDGDRARAAAWRHPEDSLDYLYKRYAAKHPMMVGEWAATHRSVVDGISRVDFAQEKIAQFYVAVPRRYPRVKAVHWLSTDTIKYAQGSRRLNDFTLLGEPSIAETYAEATSEPFYIGRIGRTAPKVPRLIQNGDNLPARSMISVYARTYVSRPVVVLKLDGQIVIQAQGSGSFRTEVPISKGRHKLVLTVSDYEGRVAGKQVVSIGTL